MIKIGEYNVLKVARKVDFGAYLADESGDEVLIPSVYIDFPVEIGKEVKVFVYRDSQERPVATTLIPSATVGEFAFMRVGHVNQVGAFLEWGVPKEILVPFSEQKSRMKEGGIYLVYVYLDHATRRVVASAKIDRFLGNVYPDYRVGQKVKVLVREETPLGFKVIVDNLHKGFVYSGTIFRAVRVGDRLDAFVTKVRDDGKIDLSLQPSSGRRKRILTQTILDYLDECGGSSPLSDKSSPDEIRGLFECSKRDFKQAIGELYREHKIIIADNGITLVKSEKRG